MDKSSASVSASASSGVGAGGSTKGLNRELWIPFVVAINKILLGWDVLRTAIDERWGDYDLVMSEKKLIDDCIDNFNERWNDNIDAEEIANFLVYTFDDLFSAEIDFGIALPVAKVIRKIYMEASTGESKGMKFILTEPIYNKCMMMTKKELKKLVIPEFLGVPSALNAASNGDDDDEDDYSDDDEEGEDDVDEQNAANASASTSASASASATNSTAVSAQASASASTSSSTAAKEEDKPKQDNVDADGWVTVASKGKKGNKGKGKN